MRRPSREDADARLKLCKSSVSEAGLRGYTAASRRRHAGRSRQTALPSTRCRSPFPSPTYRVTLLPSPSSTETKTSEHRPRPALEDQNREDHTERRAKGAADEEGAEAVVPLQSNTSVHVLILRPCDSQSPMSGRSRSLCRTQSVPSRSEEPRSWACWGGPPRR